MPDLIAKGPDAKIDEKLFDAVADYCLQLGAKDDALGKWRQVNALYELINIGLLHRGDELSEALNSNFNELLKHLGVAVTRNGEKWVISEATQAEPETITELEIQNRVLAMQTKIADVRAKMEPAVPPRTGKVTSSPAVSKSVRKPVNVLNLIEAFNEVAEYCLDMDKAMAIAEASSARRSSSSVSLGEQKPKPKTLVEKARERAQVALGHMPSMPKLFKAQQQSSGAQTASVIGAPSPVTPDIELMKPPGMTDEEWIQYQKVKTDYKKQPGLAMPTYQFGAQTITEDQQEVGYDLQFKLAFGDFEVFKKFKDQLSLASPAELKEFKNKVIIPFLTENRQPNSEERKGFTEKLAKEKGVDLHKPDDDDVIRSKKKDLDLL